MVTIIVLFLCHLGVRWATINLDLGIHTSHTGYTYATAYAAQDDQDDCCCNRIHRWRIKRQHDEFSWFPWVHRAFVRFQFYFIAEFVVAMSIWVPLYLQLLKFPVILQIALDLHGSATALGLYALLKPDSILIKLAQSSYARLMEAIRVLERVQREFPWLAADVPPVVIVVDLILDLDLWFLLLLIFFRFNLLILA